MIYYRYALKIVFTVKKQFYKNVIEILFTVKNNSIKTL